MTIPEFIKGTYVSEDDGTEYDISRDMRLVRIRPGDHSPEDDRPQIVVSAVAILEMASVLASEYAEHLKTIKE